MLRMELPQDVIRRRGGDCVGKCFAVGKNLRGLYRDEEDLEQRLRRIRRRAWSRRQGRRDRQKREPQYTDNAVTTGAVRHPIRVQLSLTFWFKLGYQQCPLSRRKPKRAPTMSSWSAPEP